MYICKTIYGIRIMSFVGRARGGEEAMCAGGATTRRKMATDLEGRAILA